MDIKEGLLKESGAANDRSTSVADDDRIMKKHGTYLKMILVACSAIMLLFAIIPGERSGTTSVASDVEFHNYDLELGLGLALTEGDNGDCSPETCPTSNCDIDCCESGLLTKLSVTVLCGKFVGPGWCNKQRWEFSESCCFVNSNKPKPLDNENPQNTMELPEGCVDYCANFHDYCCHHGESINDPMFNLNWVGGGLDDNGNVVTGGDYGNCNKNLLKCTQECLNRNTGDLTDTLVQYLGDTYGAVTYGFGEQVCNTDMADEVINIFKNEYTTSCSGWGAVNKVEAASYAPGLYDGAIDTLYGTAKFVHFRVYNDYDKEIEFVSVDDKTYNHAVSPQAVSFWLLDAITDDYREFKITVNKKDYSFYLKKSDWDQTTVIGHDGEELTITSPFKCDMQEGNPWFWYDTNTTFLEISLGAGVTDVGGYNAIGGSCVLSIHKRDKLADSDDSCKQSLQCQSGCCNKWRYPGTGTGYACESDSKYKWNCAQ